MKEGGGMDGTVDGGVEERRVQEDGRRETGGRKMGWKERINK